MSERLLKFLLGELKIVRLVCQKAGCGAVVEVSVERLAVALQAGQCPVCRAAYVGVGQESLIALARALHDVTLLRDTVQVEFVLPDREAH